MNRTTLADFPYRVIHSGIYVGDPQGMLYYPFPSREQLDAAHHEWWRSANV